ncbi:UPF0496 protein [Musa troglodytarum]|uniref:UPF0496 protein n=1 Tax=Musa troglodytarum TaxID=320322 RepID=A0A9E7H3W9_9LILI|nr:UPF0496 protein [Musa troglodytarum]
MQIRLNLFRDCKRQVQIGKREAGAPISSSSFNLCEEYINAFRTESYHEFWAQVLDLTLDHGAALKPRGSSAVASLPSYRLLAEHLLDPDQPTVTKILTHLAKRCRPEIHVLLSDYYSETADASLLCGLLLKDIDRIRRRYRPLNAALRSFVSASRSRNGLQAIGDFLAIVSRATNSFDSVASSRCKFRAVQGGSADLLKRLESGRKKTRAKLRFINRLKRTLATSAIVLAASTFIIGACVPMHALVTLTALPPFLSSSSRFASARRLDRVVAQLDAAAKGTYILNRDLDTISRLVARLHDEAEHTLTLLRLCERHGGHRRRLTQEVARQITKNLASFHQQLDELEEHLYLCFMTINRTRRLVLKESNATPSTSGFPVYICTVSNSHLHG